MAREPHGSGARRVAKNTVMLAAARIIERATTLVLTLVIAAKLGADGVGVYATAMAIYGIIAIAGEAGATSYLIRELSRERGLTSSYVLHLSVVGVVVAIVVTCVAYFVIRQVGYDATLTASVSVVLLAIVPKTLNSIQEGAFVAHGRTELQAITTLVGNAAFVAAAVYLLTRGHEVKVVLLAFVALQYATALAYHLLIAHHIAPSTWRFRWSLARKLIGEVKVFTASSVLGALFARPEIVILSLFASTTEVGYFSAAMRVAEIWVFVPQVFMNNVYALLSEAHRVADDRFRRIQERATKLVLAYTLPLTAGLAAGAGAIIPGLFGEGFDPAVDALRLMAIALTFHGLLEVYWRALAARGRQDAVLRVQLVMVGARLGGGALIIAPLAALGAALATVANTGLQLLLLARSGRRHDARGSVLGLGWRIGLASAIMGGLVWLLAEKIELWALVPVGAIAYAVALATLRAFSPHELRQIRSSLQGRAAPMAG